MTADPASERGSRVVILVEGTSDRLAVEVLARRRGRDLAADGVAVIAMHGATNLGHYLQRFGPGGLNLKLAGLCNAAEQGLLPARVAPGRDRCRSLLRRNGEARLLRVHPRPGR
jgi:hypothetical protein